MSEKTYFQQRITQLNPSPQQLKIEALFGQQLQSIDLLAGDPAGNLIIHYLNLEKSDNHYQLLSYETEGIDTYTDQTTKVTVPYTVTRLAKPKGEKKYENPKSAEAQPYLTISVIDAYNSSLPIQTLVILEGQLKAYAGFLHGLYIIGLNGIWGMRGKTSNQLHPIIAQVVDRCKVQNLVYMQDGDCRQISAYDTYKDLALRPKNFANCVLAFRNAVGLYKKDHPEASHLKAWFSHPDERHAKGLDDLLISEVGKEADVVGDLLDLKTGEFFCTYELETWDKAKTLEYFYVDSVKRFYNKHSDVLQDQEFFVKISKKESGWFQWNEESEELECKLPEVVKDFILVGNKYYKLMYELNSKGLPEMVRDQRNTEIIKNEFKRHGVPDVEEMMLKVPMYDAFANEPNFINFKKEITVRDRFHLFNLAYPIEYQPQEGDWSTIQGFLGHVFHNGGDSKLEVALDMIQMYYLHPKQKQRITSLMSRQRETGKSTYLFFLREIFGQNMSIVGNADFKSQFNGYVTKSLVGVDESKIQDLDIIESIKSMVTSPYANFNEKQIAMRPVLNHVKLVMTTNHILDFAHIDQEENRWFIIDVGNLEKKNNVLMDALKDEIPAFLHFLQHRKLMYYTSESRFGIADSVVETKALRRVKDNSRSELTILIEQYLRGRFKEYGEKKISIDATRLYQELFPDRSNRYQAHHVGQCLKNEWQLTPSENSVRFKIPSTVLEGHEMVDEDSGEVSEQKLKVVWKSDIGKVFTFDLESLI